MPIWAPTWASSKPRPNILPVVGPVVLGGAVGLVTDAMAAGSEATDAAAAAAETIDGLGGAAAAAGPTASKHLQELTVLQPTELMRDPRRPRRATSCQRAPADSSPVTERETCNSFTAVTPVLMADGSHKDIRVSQDWRQGNGHRYDHGSDGPPHGYCPDPSQGGSQDHRHRRRRKLVATKPHHATEHHPFHVTDGGKHWVEAGQLQTGLLSTVTQNGSTSRESWKWASTSAERTYSILPSKKFTHTSWACGPGPGPQHGGRVPTSRSSVWREGVRVLGQDRSSSLPKHSERAWRRTASSARGA